jgi:flavorubredoxin
MSEPFGAVRVSEHVYWVGAIDWNLRDFHGYATERGTSYNAYLVMGEKIALIDAVKKPFMEEMISRIKSMVDPLKVDYIVSNHAEMDHSGGLPELISVCQPDQVFASPLGIKALASHQLVKSDIQPVKTGDTLSLGNLTLAFVETKMVHWPDSMFTLLPEDGVLFSQDGFGMHLASGHRFADELDMSVLEYEGAKYFANILMPLSGLISNLLKKASDLSFSIIAPDHGPIWRKDPLHIVNLYAKWAEQKPTKKVVIAYDTMWESTHAMAKAIEDGMEAGGLDVRPMRIRENHRSNVATEILEAGGLLIGSPTMNNQLYPTVADVLTYLKGLKPKNLVAGAFGSYGWSGEGVGLATEYLNAMKLDVIEGLRVEYVPDKEDLVKCRELGLYVADRVNSLLS